MDSCKARRLLRVWRGVLLLSFLLFLSALWIGFDDLFSPLAPTGDTVEIPDLVGLREEEIAADDRFSVRVEYRHDDAVPRGVILSQEPSAGARRKLSPDGAQTDLSLVVSLGAKTVTLPAVAGLDVREAAQRLRAVGLSVAVGTVRGDAPSGAVLSSDPPAGSEVAVGSSVTLAVSLGQTLAAVAVPDLVGLSELDALLTLWAHGLAAAPTEASGTFDPSDDFDALGGTVVSQTHPAGTVVLAGTKIAFEVESGAGARK